LRSSHRSALGASASASAAALLALLLPTTPAPADTVHLANIVPVAAAVNDFELAPANVAITWSQQRVSATQVSGDPNPTAVWLASGLGNGTRSWYPDGGDNGWTRTTLDSGSNFDAVSFFGGSGWLQGVQTMYFELADDGAVVLSGTLAASFSGSWYGFAGGDFDEVRLRASQGVVGSLASCPSGGAGGASNACNFAWVDDIRVGAAGTLPVPVPVPATAALVVLALGLMAGAGCRTRRGARWRWPLSRPSPWAPPRRRRPAPTAR
jgi:hypothetical protein